MSGRHGARPELLHIARSWLGAVVGCWLALALVAGRAAAHGGGIGAAGRSSLRLPLWLVLLTGGAAVGASFLLSSFVTDRALLRAIDGWRRVIPGGGRSIGRSIGRPVAQLVGLVGLVAVIAVGLGGPTAGANLAVFFVWVGWWAGFTTISYLVGNA